MKYEITENQLIEMLELQKECSDAIDKLSSIGIEVEGMRLRIPQYYALLDLVLDIVGIPMDGFKKFKKDNPSLDNTKLCQSFSKQMSKEPYSFCRDNITRKCFEYFADEQIDKCLKFIISSAATKQNNKK